MGMGNVFENNGKLRVKRKNMPARGWVDLYHSLLEMRWSRLLLIVVVGYFAVNALFAYLYLCQPNSILNAEEGSFVDAFFFSIQTISTVGYGVMAPNSLYANWIVTIESIAGLLGIGTVAGLVFAKFSRPTARVVFTQRALVTQFEGKPTLMFRVANTRLNQIVDATISVTHLTNETSTEGISMRRMKELPLVRSHSPVFTLSWTVLHIIDEKSPLYKMTQAQWQANPLSNLIVTILGTDSTFYQMVHAHHAYGPKDVQWGGHYEDILEFDEQGNPIVDYSRFHNVRSS